MSGVTGMSASVCDRRCLVGRNRARHDATSYIGYESHPFVLPGPSNGPFRLGHPDAVHRHEVALGAQVLLAERARCALLASCPTARDVDVGARR
jgi:hypothetical protein